MWSLSLQIKNFLPKESDSPFPQPREGSPQASLDNVHVVGQQETSSQVGDSCQYWYHFMMN